MKDDGSSTTAGEMADWLGSIPRDTKIRFQGGLTFYRFKFRNDDLVQIEFNERVQDAMHYFNEEVLKGE